MTYVPYIGTGGYAGWKLLQRNADTQRNTISQSSEMKLTERYFTSNFHRIRSSDDLISDFRLLKLVLTAHGLEHDINNKFFIKKVLESDISDSSSLVNRLENKRYLELAQTINLHSNGEKYQENPRSADMIFSKYIDQVFGIRVGEQDKSLGTALSAQHELSVISSSGSSKESFWFRVLGSKNLKSVFEGAFGLPSSFGRLSIDRQHSDLISRSEKLFGSASPETFGESKNIEKLMRNFLLRSQINMSLNSSPYTTALAILGST